MTKLVTTDIENIEGNPLAAALAINENFQRVVNIVEELLSRNGVTPNQMEAVLDMNGNRIINLGAPANENDAVRLRDVVEGVIDIAGQTPAGGSPGQILTKDSPTDYDYSWQDPEVQAAALATVAFSGDYNDLDNLPSIPTPPVTSVNGEVGAVDLELDDLSDVTAPAPSLADVLQWNGTAWVPGPQTGGGASELDDLSDVDTSGASNGDVLTFDGTAWVPTAPTGGASDLDDLSDVTILTPSDGDVLTYDSGSSSWVAAAAPTSGSANRDNIGPESHQETPNALDDEFEYGTALDTTGARRAGASSWTAAYSSGGMTTDVNQGSFRFKSSTSPSVVNIEIPISGTFRVRARMLPLFTGSDCYLDFYVGESGGKYISVGLDTDGSAQPRHHYFRWSGFATASAFPLAASVATGWRGWNDWSWFEWEYNGTSLFCRKSATGLDGTFVQLGTETLATYLVNAPDKIGFSYFQNNTNTNMALIDCVRRYA